MSGHSKWANIKHRKGKSDAAKASVFTKIGRELAVAVKTGGADPNANSKLKDIITKARASNMPNDNITRSIKKAAGELGNINYEEIYYEGYGPGGSAVIVKTLTDNRNRTAGDVRHMFDKYGGALGTNGSVSFMFDNCGVIIIEKTEGMDDDEMMMTALDSGAEDFSEKDGIYEIKTLANNLSAVREKLEAAGLSIMNAGVENIPQNTVVLDGENLEKFQKLLEKLEENDDVQETYHNVELPEEPDEE